ncbi:MAG TPA: flagellar assembly protein FliX [Devosiaceae bacterium]
MRIDGYRSTGSIGARGGASRSGASAAFQIDQGETATRARESGPTMAASGIDALLALQAVEDPLLKRKKAMRRGKALLDVLDELRTDLLTGRMGESRLNQLMALIGQARERAEPGLDAIIDDIELRTRVELAKLGRYPA